MLTRRFNVLLEPKDREDIIHLVVGIIKVMQSEHVQLSDRHPPALYAKFLERQFENISPQSMVLLRSTGRPAHHNSPPSNLNLGTSIGAPLSNAHFAQYSQPVSHLDVHQHEVGGFNVDFSLPYFVHTVADQVNSSPSSQAMEDVWWQEVYSVNNHGTLPHAWPIVGNQPEA